MAIEIGAIRTVSKNFGTRKTNQKYGGRVANDLIKTAIWTFSYDDLPVASTNLLTFTLPVGSIPLEAYFQVLTVFAGGTSYDIDLVDSAGTAIGSGTDKLWDLISLAEIDATTTVLPASTHAGTNSGNALFVPLASAGQLKVTAAGTFTAGVGAVIMEYLIPGALP